MVRVLSMALVVLVTVCVFSQGHAFKFSEREAVSELAAQILRLMQGTPMEALPQSHTKRNSELINSLLGLPKVMNDAGRR